MVDRGGRARHSVGMQPKQKKMRRANSLWLAGLLGMGLIAGCGKPAAAPTKGDSPAPSADASNAPDSLAAESAGPKADEKMCFNCQGTGTIKCEAPGCRNGRVDCPGPCLKLDRGVWVHMNVAGHPATDVWQKFYQPDGSYEAYNQGHVGHVIMMQNAGRWTRGRARFAAAPAKCLAVFATEPASRFVRFAGARSSSRFRGRPPTIRG